MITHKDNKKNDFIDIEDTVRITYVRQKSRSKNKNWSRKDTIRFQAYKGGKNNALHRGAEIPLYTETTLLELIQALCELYKTQIK